MKLNSDPAKPCYDCGVQPGELHKRGCDIEQCPDCGNQFISCDCEGHITMPRLPWEGDFPGTLACREFGWYAKKLPGEKGWQQCDGSDPQAREDLNRLADEAIWSKEQGRYIAAPA